MTVKTEIKQPGHESETLLERFRRWSRSIFNNIDQINFYARLKDVYKILDAISIGSSAVMLSGLSRKYEEILGKPRDERGKRKRELEAEKRRAEQRTSYSWGLFADTLNTGFQLLISLMSNFDDKDRTVRIYKEFVKEELGLDRPVKFSDLKHSKNPIIRDAAAYYGRKSIIRMLPDFAGLVRWVPFLAGLAGKDSAAYKNTKFMEMIPGTTLGLGLKTAYFGWYFTERQTGSHYELISLWNNTEGASYMPNRALNQNKLPGDFVRWQEIRTLYERFREEHPEMKLTEFTPDDPLTARVFEEVARYMNHTYMPKIFRQLEPGRQEDVEEKKLTHAMLVDLIGTGGLRVDDAIGSAVRLEVMAHYGRESMSLGMKKYREVSEMLQKIKRPNLSGHATPEEGVEALHEYFKQVDSVAELFLKDEWPVAYYEKEIKPGYIKYFFKDNPPREKIDYLMHTGRTLADRMQTNPGRHTDSGERRQPENTPDRETNSWAERRGQEPASRIPAKADSFAELALTPAGAPQIAGV